MPHLVSLESRDVPATFVVNSLADNIHPDNGLTLREAFLTITVGSTSILSFAERSQISGTIGSNDVVDLTGLSGTINLIDVLATTRSVQILGPGADSLMLNANAQTRHFNFVTAGTVNSLTGLTLANGRENAGGAVCLDGTAQLTVTECMLVGNSASADGGAIYAPSTNGGKLTVIRSTLANNVSGFAGGGSGGGLFSRVDTTIDSSSFLSNANLGFNTGGAINFNTGNRIRTIASSTFVGNLTKGSGGAIGVEQADGTVVIQNSTLTNNTGSDAYGGGGISRSGGSATLSLSSTIVANNAAPNSPYKDVFTSGSVTAQSSAFTTTSGIMTFVPSGTTASLTGQDFKLGTAGKYGGPMTIVPIATDSPLVNTGANASNLSSDGRGVPFIRIAGTAADVGAYEVQSLTAAVSSAADVVDGRFGIGELSLREAVALVNANIAGVRGGGMAYERGSPATTATFTIESSIVSGNVNGTTSSDINSPSTVNVNFSTVGVAGGFTLTGGNNLPFGTDLKLASLADNGGATLTHQPAEDSPVRDRGRNLANLLFDARGSGYVRQQNTIADIGALEAPFLGIVRNTNDSGRDSLRQMIVDANVLPGAQVITFDPTVFNLPRTITLTTGEISIADVCSIVGPEPSLVTVSGNNSSRIFNTSPASSGTSILIHGLTLTAGNAGTDKEGGAVSVGNEFVTFNECVIEGNTATEGGFLDTVSESGVGGITLTRSMVRNNSASVAGGAVNIDTTSNKLTVLDSIIMGNVAGKDGGAFAIESSSPSVIRNSTLHGNSAGRNGGAVSIASFGALTIQNATMTRNTAAAYGGGLSRSGTGTTAITSSIIAENSALAELDLSASANAVPFVVNTSAIGSVEGYTIGSGTGNLTPGSDLKLGPLQDNSGSTLTRLPAADSPLRGAGSNPANLTTDQRGLPRNFGTATDIGAVTVRTTTISSITRTSPQVNNATTLAWVVTFADAIMGLSAANVALTGTAATGATLTLSAFTGSSATFTATGFSSGILELRFDNSVGLDWLVTTLSSSSYTIDRAPPVGVSLTPSPVIVTDAAVGPQGFSTSVVFNETMDTTTAPTVSFPAEFPASLTFQSGSWFNSTTYRVRYDVADFGIIQPNIDIQISGAKDAVGNVQSEWTVADAFSIDTQNALVSSISTTTPNGTYTPGQSVNVTLNFTRAVMLTGVLNITMDTGAVVSIVGPANGTTLSGTYNIGQGQVSSDLKVTAIALMSDGTLKDSVGNRVVLALPTSNLAQNAAIVIGATQAVTAVTINNGATQRSRVFAIALDFALPLGNNPVGTIVLTRADGVTVGLGSGMTIATPTPNRVVLNFSNELSSGVEYGSLADGRWRLHISGLGIIGPAIHRFFGDTNGDGTVDGGTDFAQFAFRTATDDSLDWNNDGTIDGGTDFAQFGIRFGRTL